jgi:hypothetical protein
MADPAMVAARAARVLGGIFRAIEVEKALDWAVIRGTPETRRLMGTKRDELQVAWEKFSKAGSVAVARQVVQKLPSDTRRLFIIFTVGFLRGQIEGDTENFIALDRAVRIPGWFSELIQ